jgi:hypothetical protein
MELGIKVLVLLTSLKNRRMHDIQHDKRVNNKSTRMHPLFVHREGWGG